MKTYKVFDSKLWRILGWEIRFTNGRFVCDKNGAPELEFYADAQPEQIMASMNEYDRLVGGLNVD